MGQKYLAGRSEPLHFIGFSFKQAPRLRYYQRSGRVRRGGRVQDVAILKAIGVNRFGTREVLGLSARISEAEVHWRGFLGDLHKRGLRGVELFGERADGKGVYRRDEPFF